MKTGEVSCVPKNEDDIERYLINSDKIYMLDGKVYRLFEDELIGAPQESTPKLL